jgi:hypothetical protein
LDESVQMVGDGAQSVDTASLTATVLTAVERQLTRYFAAMTERVDASLSAAERLRDEVRDELAVHVPRVESSLDAQRVASDASHEALRRTFDERVADVAAHHTSRLHELDVRLTTVAARPVGVTPEDLLQIRESMRRDIRGSLEPVTERLDALVEAQGRTDDHAAALVQHVNTSTTMLLARIDDGDERISAELGEQLGESSGSVASRLDALDAVSASLAAWTTERDAALADEIAAVRDRSADAVLSATARTSELEERLRSTSLDLATLAAKMVGIDQDAIEDLKGQMSAAIGEAMLVRIELDRVHSSLDERLDKNTVRLSEIEALLADEMDVGAAVQLERLDELERAIVLLDPEQFVRRDESSTSSAVAMNPNHDGDEPSSSQAPSSPPLAEGR